MSGFSKYSTIKHKINLSWDDFLEARMRREDELVKQKFVQYAYLGRGHMRTDLIRWWREDE